MELETGKSYEIINLTFCNQFYGGNLKEITINVSKCLYYDGLTKPRNDINKLVIVGLENENVFMDLYINDNLIKRIQIGNRTGVKNRDYIMFTVESISEWVEIHNNAVIHEIPNMLTSCIWQMPQHVTSSKTDNVQPFPLEVTDIRGEDGYSLYRVDLHFIIYSEDVTRDFWDNGTSGIIKLDITDFSYNKELNRFYYDGLLNDNEIDLHATPVLITTKYVYFDDTNFDNIVVPVDEDETGKIYDVNYGDDITIEFKLIRDGVNLSFSNVSADDYIRLVKEDLGNWEHYFESIDGEVDEINNLMIIHIHKVAVNVDLYHSLSYPSALDKLQLNGTLPIKYDLLNVTPDTQPVDIGRYRPLSLYFVTDAGYIIDPSGVVILMGGSNVTNDVFNFNTNTLYIEYVTADVDITVHATPKWSIIFRPTHEIEPSLIHSGSKEVESISFAKENNSYIVKVNGTTLGTLDIPLTENQTVIGLGIDGSQEVFVPLNVTINNVDIEKYGENYTLNLYPIIVSTEDPTTFDIELYNMNCDKNKVDKTNDISIVSTLTGTLREQCDVMNPVITIETSRLPTFNYVYIPAFRRYYFLNEVTVVSNALYRISLHVDVLMTYRNEIRSQKCMVARNEFTSDPMLVDVMRKTTNEKEILSPTFFIIDPESWFDNVYPQLEDLPIILQVMGKE